MHTMTPRRTGLRSDTVARPGAATLQTVMAAPVGSALCGSWELIKRAHRIRKMTTGLYRLRFVSHLGASGVVGAVAAIRQFFKV